MGNGDTVIGSAPLGHNAEFSRQVLDSKEILDSIQMSLRGRVRVWDDKLGAFKEITLKSRAFSSECIGWAMGKFEEALSSTMKLSHYNNSDFGPTAIAMTDDFDDELWLNWKQFEMTDAKYIELCNKYRNFVDQGLRHPLNKGIRDFLQSTTGEQIQRVTQNITENQERKGFLGKLGLG